jgi:hypothetical protein
MNFKKKYLLCKGYENLKKKNNLDLIIKTKKNLTNVKFNFDETFIFLKYFNSKSKNIESILSQYLMSRVASYDLNKSILIKEGDNSKLKHPLPSVYLKTLKKENIDIDIFQCFLLWRINLIKEIIKGIYLFIGLFFYKNENSVNNYIYFDNLNINNLTSNKSNENTKNIITWSLNEFKKDKLKIIDIQLNQYKIINTSIWKLNIKNSLSSLVLTILTSLNF